MEKKEVMRVFALVLVSLSFVSLVLAWGEYQEGNYNLEGADFICEGRTATESFWNDGTDSFSSVNDCYKSENPDNMRNCCPIGMVCDTDSGNCYYDVETCGDYETQASCEGENRYVVGVVSVEDAEGSDSFCGSSLTENIDGDSCLVQFDNCRCEWNSTDCVQAYDRGVDCDEDGSPDSGSSGKCRIQKKTVEDNCQEGGSIIVTSVQRWYSGGSWGTDTLSISKKCEDKVNTISCGELVVKLPFFTVTNLIILVVILFIFYVIWKNHGNGAKDAKKGGRKAGKRKKKK